MSEEMGRIETAFEEIRNRGQQAIDAGQLEEAVAILQEAVDLAAGRGDTRLIDLTVCNRAAALVELGRGESELPRLREILVRNNDPVNCRIAAYTIARHYEVNKNYKKALFYARITLDRSALLSYEEIERLVRILSAMGVHDVRLTGGEPLARRELWKLVEMLSADENIHDLSLTTNGYLLERQVEQLVRAGLRRVNVSLDALAPDRFFQLTRRNSLQQVLSSLAAAEKYQVPIVVTGFEEERNKQEKEERTYIFKRRIKVVEPI